MSSSDTPRPAAIALSRRSVLTAGMTLGLGFITGCTVRPLYGDASAPGAGPGLTAQLAQIEIAPVSDRVGQEVRNHLIFLFGGGKGQPVQPTYRLSLTTRVSKSVPATINTGRISLEPTAGIVTVRATYTLSEATTGKILSNGNRSVQAPYDIPVQEFAAKRAVLNAEDRAARELAQLLNLVVAQELERQARNPGA